MDEEMSIEAEENLTEEEFWEELDDVVSTPCRSHDRIDDTLRTWIGLTIKFRESYLRTPDDLARCALKLLDSTLFARHEEYVRRQLVFALLQEDDPPTLHLIAAFLLFDGRQNEASFGLVRAEGGFPRLIDLIRDSVDDDLGLHKRLLELLYETARIQMLSWDDLVTVDDAFVLYLFRIIESLANDVNDPYHYPVIRVLLVLNEQYMVSAHELSPDPVDRPPITNRVIKVLSIHGVTYKTFGENIILLLNRESETSLQLLILKLLYLLFTSQPTQEYFYTNDLHVLTDILIRNLLDLPAEPQNIPSPQIYPSTSPTTTTTTSLRHTYLRVLHPLLAHTQLRNPPHYKRLELRKLLFVLADTGPSHRHFEKPDETIVRLVRRCLSIPWLSSSEDSSMSSDSTAETPGDAVAGAEATSETETDNETMPRVKAGKAIVADKKLGISLPEAKGSALSVMEVATQRERPGVLAPSRRRSESSGNVAIPAGTSDSEGLVRESTSNSSFLSPVQELGRSPFDDDH